MTVSQVRALQPGDEVKWNDPDRGLCSRVIKIFAVEVCSDGENDNEDDVIIKICDTDGDYVEVFAHELE